jgi:hypothetical protein
MCKCIKYYSDSRSKKKTEKNCLKYRDKIGLSYDLGHYNIMCDIALSINANWNGPLPLSFNGSVKISLLFTVKVLSTFGYFKVNLPFYNPLKKNCKILEGIVNTAVMKHLIDNKLLTDSQHGFRSGCLVETNLIDTYGYVTELLDLGIPADMILVDFAKVFDKVCHHCLKARLLATRIHVEVVEWVMQFLSGRN